MKRVKEFKQKLKQRVAALLIFTLMAANMSIPGLAAMVKEGEYKLVMDLSETELYVGDTKTLKVSVASGSEASPAEASSSDGEASPGEATPPELKDVVWKSSNTELVTVTGSGSTATIEAIAPGPATVTAICGKYTATCTVWVTGAPEMKAKLSRSSIEYDGTSTLTVTVDGLEENEEFTPSFSLEGGGALEDKLDIEIIKDTDSGKSEQAYAVTAVNGYSGTYEIKVEVTKNDKPLTDSVTLTVKAPTLKLTTAATSLEVKGQVPAEILAVTNCKAFNKFEWSVEGEAVRITSADTDSESIQITPAAAGTAVLHVTAGCVSNRSPGRAAAAEGASATAKLTFTVTDSRQFAVSFADKEDEKQGYITLDINKAAPKTSASFTVINDFDGGFTAAVLNSEDEEFISVKTEGNKVTVTTTAEEPAIFEIEVMGNSADSPAILIPVNVITSADPVKVEDSDIETDISSGAVKTPKLNTGKLTEPLTQEQKAAAEAERTTQAAEIDSSIREALNAVLPVFDTEAAKELIGKLAGDFGSVKPGESVKVYPKQTLNDVQMDSEVTVDPVTKAVSVNTVITKMSFDIDLMMQKLDVQGSDLGGPQNLGAMMARSNNQPITFPLPLPSTGIRESARYAKVTHGGDVTYSPILGSSGSLYVEISTTHFSIFDLEFVDSIPTVNPPSRSSGGRGYSSSGQWLQDSLGWRYKSAGGTYTVNTWKSLLWNNTMQWYRFNPDGYMAAGWFTDADGSRYFLHNISDGTQGCMYIGWHQIEGKWYYFKENAGGPQGSLLINGVTPDGYTVDSMGIAAGYPRAK